VLCEACPTRISDSSTDYEESMTFLGAGAGISILRVSDRIISQTCSVQKVRKQQNTERDVDKDHTDGPTSLEVRQERP